MRSVNISCSTPGILPWLGFPYRILELGLRLRSYSGQGTDDEVFTATQLPSSAHLRHELDFALELHLQTPSRQAATGKSDVRASSCNSKPRGASLLVALDLSALGYNSRIKYHSALQLQVCTRRHSFLLLFSKNSFSGPVRGTRGIARRVDRGDHDGLLRAVEVPHGASN